MNDHGATGSKVAPTGLTATEAQDRFRQFGPNRVEEERRHLLRTFFAKFWAPVPWMLEATIVLEVLVHKPDEAVIIGALLLFNSVLSFVQENQANRALSLLRCRLLLLAAVAFIPLKWVQVKMLPFDNKSEFQVIIDMPDGTPLEQTTRVAQALGTYLGQQPEVINYQIYSGT